MEQLQFKWLRGSRGNRATLHLHPACQLSASCARIMSVPALCKELQHLMVTKGLGHWGIVEEGILFQPLHIFLSGSAANSERWDRAIGGGVSGAQVECTVSNVGVLSVSLRESLFKLVWK